MFDRIINCLKPCRDEGKQAAVLVPCRAKIFALAGFGLLATSTSFAYSFVPTESEFRTWPPFCKVVYVRTVIGKSSGLDGLISERDFIAGNAVLARKPPYGEGGAHHLCAGMKWLERARTASDPTIREKYLTSAKTETMFTLERAQTGSFISNTAMTTMAETLFELGDASEALALLERGIPSSGGEPSLYLLKATIHHRKKEYSLARDALLEANSLASGQSADVHYNLGLVLIKLGDYEEAAKHAHLAYQAGYPLPGLRRQLERVGHWEMRE